MTAPQPRPCDRCAAPSAALLFHNQDSLSGERFAVVRCANCGLARTIFAADWSELGRYYGSAYYGEGEAGRRFVAPMEWLVARFRQARVQRILRAHQRPTPGAILDIGCGRGLILQALRERGWECHGTELSETLAATLAKKNIRIHTQPHLADAHLPARHFDVVTLWHSLEHLPDPAQTLAEIARVLKPGGRLLLEVPNLESWQAKLGGGRWFHLDTPRHLYHFTPSQLTQMLAEHGLVVTATATLSLEQGPYGMVQTLLNRLTTQNNVLYSLLKRHFPVGRGAGLVWDIGVTLLALPIAGVVGVALELLASLLGRGAVIRIQAEHMPRMP